MLTATSTRQTVVVPSGTIIEVRLAPARWRRLPDDRGRRAEPLAYVRSRLSSWVKVLDPNHS